MTSLKRIAFVLVAGAAVLTSMSGCALFTAQRVGTFAAKETGKAVYRSYREHQREREASSDSGDGGRYESVREQSEE